ncbi:MAG: hypothetical protein ACW98D_22015, partial [Promethearchaeota archaeon]
MPQFKDLKKWILPFLMVIILFIVMSCAVSKNKKYNNPIKYEHFDQIDTSSISTDKIKLLLPYLKSYVNYKYPTRESVTDKENTQPATNVWEDLSGSKNEMIWAKVPVVDENGYHTLNNSLTASSAKTLNFDETDQFTFIMRAKALENIQASDSEIVSSSSLGEIFANIKANIEGKVGDMSLNVPASIKESFTQLKEHLTSENQTQETLQQALNEATDIQNSLNELPNKGKRQYKPTALAVYGDNNKELELRLSKAAGNIEI